jgi:hypothetical protein
MNGLRISITANGGNSLVESVTMVDVADGSSNPRIDWTDHVTSASGSAAFLAAFGNPPSVSMHG